MDAIFVGKMSIAAKRHISQFIQERRVRSCGELVEDGFQLTVFPPLMYMQTVLPCLGALVRRIQSVAVNSDGAAFQVGVGNLVLLLWQHLGFHGRVTDLRQS